jgi:hypothetical protein
MKAVFRLGGDMEATASKVQIGPADRPETRRVSGRLWKSLFNCEQSWKSQKHEARASL